jgi:hypothetical protein
MPRTEGVLISIRLNAFPEFRVRREVHRGCKMVECVDARGHDAKEFFNAFSDALRRF